MACRENTLKLTPPGTTAAPNGKLRPEARCGRRGREGFARPLERRLELCEIDGHGVHLITQILDKAPNPMHEALNRLFRRPNPR